MAPNNFDRQLIGVKRSIPQSINLLTMFRLGLYQAGLGMMSILTLGVLNRILIDRNLLAIPATLAGGAIAMYQFVSPTRIWFGQMSDNHPLWGYRRTSYIWLGAALFTVIVYLAVQVIWQLGANISTGWTLTTLGWSGLLALMFALYGLCIDCSSTSFSALLVDVSDEEDRGKLVGIVWSMLMVGITVGAVISSKLLEGLTRQNMEPIINRLFLIVPALVFLMSLIATVGVERKYSRYHSRTIAPQNSERVIGTAFKVLTASRQTGVFFTFLMVMTISLFMQQPVLEPYAGEVFGMTVAQSAKLHAFWGIGTLISLTLTGFAIIPRLGKQQTAKLGCLLVAGCFILMLLVGFSRNQVWLESSVFLLGLGFGVVTNGAISLMLDLTVASAAGTFLGAWGLAQAIAQALATVGGGAVLNLGRQIFTVPVFAYGLVFALEILGMVLAFGCLLRVNVAEFRKQASFSSGVGES